jgi:hypothetical protein
MFMYAEKYSKVCPMNCWWEPDWLLNKAFFSQRFISFGPYFLSDITSCGRLCSLKQAGTGWNGLSFLCIVVTTTFCSPVAMSALLMTCYSDKLLLIPLISLNVKLIGCQLWCTRCAFRLIKSPQWCSCRKSWKSWKNMLLIASISW